MSAAPNARTSDAPAWTMIAAMLLACLLACAGLGFGVRPGQAMSPAIGLLLLGGAVAIGRRTGRPRLTAGATAFLQMTLFTVAGVVLAYGLAARAGASWDPALAAADRRLGFDWPAIFRTLDAHPVAVWIGGLAYHSLIAQMVVAIVVLAACRRTDQLRVAVAAAIGSGFVTILISALMPAGGNLFDPAGYRHLWPSVAWSDRALVAGLRDGSRRLLDLGQMTGIVSFPSYHATLPTILAWAQRGVPRMRVIAPAWAAVTIVATPVFGGHYAVDVLAGILLAVVAIVLAPRVTIRQARPGAVPSPVGIGYHPSEGGPSGSRKANLGIVHGLV